MLAKNCRIGHEPAVPPCKTESGLETIGVVQWHLSGIWKFKGKINKLFVKCPQCSPAPNAPNCKKCQYLQRIPFIINPSHNWVDTKGSCRLNTFKTRGMLPLRFRFLLCLTSPNNRILLMTPWVNSQPEPGNSPSDSGNKNSWHTAIPTPCNMK